MHRRLAVVIVTCLAAIVLPGIGVAPALAAEGGECQSAMPVHLHGSDSVADTQQVLDAFGVGITAQKFALLEPLYAKDVVYDDFCFLVHSEWRPSIMLNLRRSLRQASGVRVLASHADEGWGVIEHSWDMLADQGVWLQPITLIEIRDGQIVYEGWYFRDPWALLPDGTALVPTPLASAPGPADTAGAAEAVALKYAVALQTKDAAAMAALSAAQIAFMDTAASSVAGSPGQVRAHYAGIFKTPADLVFENLRYVCGQGWAAVMWTASAQSAGSSGEGATMLEIRAGKIARETLYYTLANVPFGL